MTELEKYRMIGSVDECRNAMIYYRNNYKPLHEKNENCNTCKDHNNCSKEKYSCWCIHYKAK